MPSRNDLPGDISRKKFTRALERLGFVINKRGGDGSHYKIIWPPAQKMVVVPHHLHKGALRYVLKEIEAISKITWEDITRQL